MTMEPSPDPHREAVSFREIAADGTLVPAWMDADDDGPRRIEVAVHWVPQVFVNGVEVSERELEVEPLPAFRVRATVTRRALIANREASVRTEVWACTAGAHAVADAIVEETMARLPRVLHRTVARRGFPLP